MLEAIDGALKYAGTDRAAFFHDEMRKDAVVRKLEVIGEAAKGLRDIAASDTALAGLMEPDAMDWRGAAGMRDWLIHKYWAVDYDLVWRAVADDLPRLRKSLEKLRAVESTQG